MRYEEHPPTDDLSGVVQARWVVHGEVGESVRITPDACVDVIALDDGISTLVLNGPMPVAEVIELWAPVVYGIRFVPGTLPRLGGLSSLAELRGRQLELGGPSGTGTPASQLLSWVRTLMTEGKLQRHRAVDELMVRMIGGSSGTAIRDVGPRQMQRLFAQYVGMSPQETFGVIRQSMVTRRLRSGANVPLAELAAQEGFADQAHFTRTFRRLAGIAPAAYRNEIADDVFVQDHREGLSDR